MAAPQVHNMVGRSCKLCNHPFTPASMNLTISVKQPGFIEKQRVCGKCYNEYMSKGE